MHADLPTTAAAFVLRVRELGSPLVGTTFEQFKAALLNPAARRSIGIELNEEQARLVAGDEALARAHYDHWQRTYRSGTMTIAESPSNAVVQPRPVPPPPGWYPGHNGQMQWWDGTQWVAGAYTNAVVPTRIQKDVGVSYLLAILLGGFAAHRFYLGRIGSAFAFLGLWWVGWITTGLIIGIFMVLAAAIWWIVDLFLIPDMVRTENQSIRR